MASFDLYKEQQKLNKHLFKLFDEILDSGKVKTSNKNKSEGKKPNGNSKEKRI